jgi:hypothetical protein
MARWSRTLVRTAGVALISIGATATSWALADPGLAANAPVSRGICKAAKWKPRRIVLSADGSGVLAGYKKPGHEPYSGGRIPGMRWSHWTSTSASTHAYEWIDDGYPSVGAGTYYAIPVHISLWRPRDGVFTRMRVISHARKDFHPNPDWKNPPRRQTFRASSCGSGTWSW